MTPRRSSLPTALRCSYGVIGTAQPEPLIPARSPGAQPAPRRATVARLRRPGARAVRSRIAGNSTTSRIELRPVSSITSRSMPRPTPPRRAACPARAPARRPRRRAAPRSPPAASRRCCASKRSRCSSGSFSSLKRVGDLHAAGERLAALDQPWPRAVLAGERRELDRVVEDERRAAAGRLDVLRSRSSASCGQRQPLGAPSRVRARRSPPPAPRRRGAPARRCPSPRAIASTKPTRAPAAREVELAGVADGRGRAARRSLRCAPPRPRSRRRPRTTRPS